VSRSAGEARQDEPGPLLARGQQPRGTRYASEPDVLAQEIADNRRTALEQFSAREQVEEVPPRPHVASLPLRARAARQNKAPRCPTTRVREKANARPNSSWQFLNKGILCQLECAALMRGALQRGKRIAEAAPLAGDWRGPGCAKTGRRGATLANSGVRKRCAVGARTRPRHRREGPVTLVNLVTLNRNAMNPGTNQDDRRNGPGHLGHLDHREQSVRSAVDSDPSSGGCAGVGRVAKGSPKVAHRAFRRSTGSPGGTNAPEGATEGNRVHLRGSVRPAKHHLGPPTGECGGRGGMMRTSQLRAESHGARRSRQSETSGTDGRSRGDQIAWIGVMLLSPHPVGSKSQPGEGKAARHQSPQELAGERVRRANPRRNSDSKVHDPFRSLRSSHFFTTCRNCSRAGT
jgi:hypothetical protein